MNRRFKKVTWVRAGAVLGVVGAACLTRPVETWDPNLKTNFSNVIHNQAVDKIDLLFMIDNSASMGDKQNLLAQAVPDLINRLVQPNCVDNQGNSLGVTSDPNTGQCSMGKPEFPPVHDMHIGIVDSSLGGRGAPMTCNPADSNEANPSVNAHNDDQAHLINRGSDSAETPVAKASAGFLAWFPDVQANRANPTKPSNPETSIGAQGMSGTLIGDFTDMVTGVHEHGCGFEAQNEAWYRFLVQPDPFDPVNGIQIDSNNRAHLTGIDPTILSQRAAFLRPDSLLTVIVVTDENEEVANPVSIGGEGWLYEAAPFPSSPTFGAPEGTIECASNPNDPNCTSCAFQSVQMSSNFASRCPNDPPMGMQGFLDPSNDNVNVRFWHQKQRFGVFAGYPITRYIRGLTKPSVPDRAHEVDGQGNYVGDQDKFANCVNPIFAQDLPTDPTKDLCHLTRGPRTPDLVYYAAIAGVPHELLQAQAGVDPECPAGTAPVDCPQKKQLTESDWQTITGHDAENYDFSGADFHMLESEDPRQGASCSPASNDNCDSTNGRERNTQKQDLQFSCIFPLVDAMSGTPITKDCTQMQYKGACDCVNGNVNNNSPLCQKSGGMYTSNQIFGKAYPSVREMEIAHAMANSTAGVQGIVSSLCPIHTQFANGNMTDPLYGYRPAANAIVDRLKATLQVQCLPQQLIRNPDTQEVPCLILVTLPKPASEDTCNQPGIGFTVPDSNILARYRASLEAQWLSSGGMNSGLPDPNTVPICQLTQLTQKANPNDFDASGTCTASQESGWCYVEGAAAGSCPQQILFTTNEPPPGASVSLQCIEKANSALDASTSATPAPANTGGGGTDSGAAPATGGE